MNKKAKNNKIDKSFKTIKVDSNTHKDLLIYKARKELKTMGDAVRDLLYRAPGNK